ncbi:MAG: plasmid replication protein, CyRepA1 family, partial [Xenococcaceae cyanobacterium]
MSICIDRPNYISQAHWQEWLNSRVDTDLTANNIKSLSDTTPYEYLWYALEKAARRNDGRVRNTWINRYKHTEYGGWWCNGVDVLTGADSEWGQFKPDRPRCDSDGDILKYESPPKTETGIYALKVNFFQSWNIVRRLDDKAKDAWIQRFWQAIAREAKEADKRAIGVRLASDEVEQIEPDGIKRFQFACSIREYREIDRVLRAIRDISAPSEVELFCVDRRRIERLGKLIDTEFWQWVIDSNAPVTITEGAKKAGCLLTLGVIAIALPGIFNGYRTDKNSLGKSIKGSERLIPQLEVFTKNKREISFCFDRDLKPKTVHNLKIAISRTGKLLEAKGCEVNIISWHHDSKGVDDLVKDRGEDAFWEAYNNRQPLSKLFPYVAKELDLSPYVSLNITSKYLTDLDENGCPHPIKELNIPRDAQLIALKAHKGAGKTELFAWMAGKAIEERRRVILICHREQLARSLAKRLGLDYRTDIRYSIQKGFNGFTLCIDSLHPKANPPFNENDWAGALVLIDEVEQTYWHLLNSNTCIANRCQIISSLQRLLQKVVATGGSVAIADADLTPIALKYTQDLIGSDINTFVVNNNYKPEQKRELHIYKGKTPKGLVAMAMALVKQGVKIILHTGGKEDRSRYGTRNLEKHFLAEFGDLRKILRLDAETVADVCHPAYQATDRLNELLLNYDIVIASSVIETGVSIDIRGHFGAVVCIAQGLQPIESVCQSLARVRDDIPRYLWAVGNAIGIGRIADGSFSKKELISSQAKLARKNIELLLGNAYDGDDNLNPISLNTWATRACIINIGLSHYREAIVEKLVHEEGYKAIEAVVDGKEADRIEKVITEIKEEAYSEYCEIQATVKTPSLHEQKQLERKRTKTRTEAIKERKGSLARRYGEENITPELVRKDDNGWYPKLKHFYYATMGNQYVGQKDKSTYKKLSNEGRSEIFAPDINSRLLF